MGIEERGQKPAAEGLFTWPSDTPRLIGGRCESCETYFFPKFAQFHRPGCPGGPVQEVLLAREGKLTSYTIEYYPPPSPFVQAGPFSPLAIGLIALPEGIQIPGQMTDVRAEELRTGMDVEIVIDTLNVDDEGNEVMTWKLRPLRQ